MSMIPSLADVVETIENLKAGDQAWFWLAPSRVKGAPQMLLSPLSKDPGMKDMQSWSRQMPTEDIPYMGLCAVREDGIFEFAGALIDDTALNVTAKWVNKFTERYPKLSKLSRSRFLRVGTNGVIGVVYEDSDLWASEPLSAIGLAAEQIEQAEVGQAFWLWLASIGPSMRPTLRLIPRDEDPDAVYFGSLVGSLQRRCTMGGQFVRGTLYKTESGWGLVTNDDVRGWEQLRNAVVYANADNYPAFYQLLELQLIKLTLNSSTAASAEGSADQSAYTAVQERLELLSEENSLMFVFGVRSGSTVPSLVLGQSKDDFKGVQWDEGKINGRVALKKGLVLFQSKLAYSGFITALAAWVGQAEDVSALSKLKNARFMQRDAEGNTIDRQKDDDAWTRVFG